MASDPARDANQISAAPSQSIRGPQAIIRGRPLKTMVFQILLLLTEGERHGYHIVKELEVRIGDGRKILPGNLYRTLRSMLADGLITESEMRPDPELDDDRRRYFRLTDKGLGIARAEARRLEELVVAARSRDLLSAR